MAYTTKALLRTNSGFTDSTLVADSVLDAKIAYADALINAKVASVYAIPLANDGVAATPDLVAMLSLEISTVLLLMAQYSEQAQDTDKGWEKRLKMAQSILDDIAEQKTRLIFSDGNEADRTTFRQPAFYPNDTSSDPSADDTTEPKFTMNRVF